MRRGLLATLGRMRTMLIYYSVDDINAHYKRNLLREAKRIEAALRMLFTEQELDAALSCAIYVDSAVQQLEYRAEHKKRYDHFTLQALILSKATKRVMGLLAEERKREQRQKK